ncbi:hypothetical protein ACWDZ4_35005 [Streptomyces sp. NPDC003016]
MRSISATFRMTEPADAQAMKWMTATVPPRTALGQLTSDPGLTTAAPTWL